MSESRFLMTGGSEKDDVNRVIQAALFVRVPLEKEGTIQAPVITLQVLKGAQRACSRPQRAEASAWHGRVSFQEAWSHTVS
jgi:hypothetical protein